MATFFVPAFYFSSSLQSREQEKHPAGMPHISAAAALQICALLSAFPAQYFISQWYGTDSAQRILLTERL